MPPAGFEPAIPASERPQTLAFDRAAAGIDDFFCYAVIFFLLEPNILVTTPL
jgi:hypothetical protein